MALIPQFGQAKSMAVISPVEILPISKIARPILYIGFGPNSHSSNSRKKSHQQDSH
jgi:hypothetical protein